MIQYQKKYLAIFYRLFVLLFLFQLCRLSFYLINFNDFSYNSNKELASIFLHGSQFDFNSIAILNGVFCVLYLLPFSFANNKHYIQSINFMFCIVNGAALFFNFVDCAYFPYINKRTTFDLFLFMFQSNDVKSVLPRFIVDFWYIIALWLGTLGLGWFLLKRSPWTLRVNYNFKWFTSMFLLFEVAVFLGVLFVGIRGTGMRSMNFVSASQYTTTSNFPMILNTPFSIFYTMNNDRLKKVTYFAETTAIGYFNPVRIPHIKTQEKTNNVVIIILESFSSCFVGSHNGEPSLTPFLDSLVEHSLVFDKAFANGKRSIEALPSIFASIPSLTGGSYVNSQYAGNAIYGLPAILNSKGYHTSFFHGGHNGTMRFDDFCRAAGISEYYGMNEYHGPPAMDSEWGINDEEFLDFFASKLDGFPEPFMSSIFTLSSHHPFGVPKRYQTIFKEGKSPITKTIQYTDYSLRKFFNTVSKKDWYKNTLFILTADHTAPDYNQNTSSMTDQYHIPMIFYHPGESCFIGKSEEIAQQADIMPTVLDYLQVKTPYISFGNSLIANNAKTFAVQYIPGVYNIIYADYYLQFDGEKTLSFAPFLHKKAAHEDCLKLQMENTLKAIIQQYNERLIDNRLVEKQ